MRNDSLEVLAKLLSSSSLREEFICKPIATLDRLGVVGSVRDFCLGLSTPQLVAQAKILIKKRMREVSQIVPLTMLCQAEQGTHLFKIFADTFWPTGHMRHLVDACRFCEYLKQHGFKINQSEYYRLKFHLDNERYCLHLVRDALIAGRYRTAVQFQFRYRKRIYERRFYFSFSRRRVYGRDRILSHLFLPTILRSQRE